MAGLLGGLFAGIGAEGVAVFDDLDRLRIVGKRVQRESVAAEQHLQLLAFLVVASAENENAGVSHEVQQKKPGLRMDALRTGLRVLGRPRLITVSRDRE